MSQVDTERLLKEASGQLEHTAAALTTNEALRDPLTSEAPVDPLTTTEPTTGVSKAERRTILRIASTNTTSPARDNKSRFTLAQLLPRLTEDDFKILRRDFKRAGLDLKTVLKSWSKGKSRGDDRLVYRNTYETCKDALQYKTEPDTIEELRSQSHEPRSDVEALLTPRERISYRLRLVENLNRLGAAETDPVKAKAIQEEASKLLQETLKMNADLKKQRAAANP